MKLLQNEKKINFNLFRKYFEYISPVDMYKNLIESINIKRNKIQTESIKNTLTNLKKDTPKNTPKDNANEIEENKKITDIVEHILYFNEENQQGSGLNILPPSQMLSRLPISLTQLNTGNNSEKFKKWN